MYIQLLCTYIYTVYCNIYFALLLNTNEQIHTHTRTQMTRHVIIIIFITIIITILLLLLYIYTYVNIYEQTGDHIPYDCHMMHGFISTGYAYVLTMVISTASTG